MELIEIVKVVRSLAPMVDEFCHMAQEMFPTAQGSDKLNFVVTMLDQNYPPDAAARASFDAIKPMLTIAINAAVEVYKVCSAAFQKKAA